jgi:heme/copper-type cytochrome/quinol oxidase subunit 2
MDSDFSLISLINKYQDQVSAPHRMANIGGFAIAGTFLLLILLIVFGLTIWAVYLTFSSYKRLSPAVVFASVMLIIIGLRYSFIFTIFAIVLVYTMRAPIGVSVRMGMSRSPYIPNRVPSYPGQQPSRY